MISGFVSWGNGEPCPFCGEMVEGEQIQHLMKEHEDELAKTLFPEEDIPTYGGSLEEDLDNGGGPADIIGDWTGMEPKEPVLKFTLEINAQPVWLIGAHHQNLGEERPVDVINKALLEYFGKYGYEAEDLNILVGGQDDADDD